MSKSTNAFSRRLPWQPYWLVILVLLLLALGIYLYHLITGVTPSRVAITIPGVEFEIFWYGIWIVGGIALGCWVVAELANERGQKLFWASVPARIRQKPLSVLALPDQISDALTKQKITTLGELLLPWGFDPRRVGLNKEGIAVVTEKMAAADEIEETWVDDAPWRIWNPDHVWNGIIWCLILAVIGARLYHILTPSPSMAAVGITSPLDYFRNPYQLINFRNGGLGIYGGIAGGALGLFLYSRRARIPMLAWADIAVVGLALGQVFGRWGNFFNQELYGRPSTLPWAVQIDPIHRLSGYEEFASFHPAFLYESLWSLLAFIVLYRLAKRYSNRLLTGELMALYLIFYAVGRTLLELVRLDSRTMNLGFVQIDLAVATVVSLVIAVVAAVWIIIRRRRMAH